MLLNLFFAWRRLGKLQKAVGRMADLQDRCEDELARIDAHERALEALLAEMREAVDDPARLQALEDELLDLDPAVWHEYQVAMAD